MKTYIKASVLTVLLMAIFTISFNSANAENENLIVNGINATALKANNYSKKSICLVNVMEWGQVVTKMVPCERSEKNQH